MKRNLALVASLNLWIDEIESRGDPEPAIRESKTTI